MEIKTNLLAINFQDTKEIVDKKLIDLFSEISGICGSISVFMILEFWKIEYDIEYFLKLSNDGIKENEDGHNGSNVISLSYTILKCFNEFVNLDIYWNPITDLDEKLQKQKDEIEKMGGTFNKAIDIDKIVNLMSNDSISIIGFNEHFSPLKGYQKSNNKIYFPNFKLEFGDCNLLLNDFLTDKSWIADKTCIMIKRKKR